MQLHDERKRYPCDGKENTLSPCQNQTPASSPLPRHFTDSAGIGSILTGLRTGQFRVQTMAGKEIYLFSVMDSLTEVHATLYSVGTGGSLPGGKVARV